MYTEENGELCFEVTSEEFDPMFDEIGSQLKIKEIQRDKQDLLQSLQLYYKVFFLGGTVGGRYVISHRCWKYQYNTWNL